MAELPGWDRRRLRTADPADVEAARWIAFSREIRPILRRDYAGEIAQLEAADKPPTAAQARSQRRRDIEELRAAQRSQAELRKLLELDVEGDD